LPGLVFSRVRPAWPGKSLKSHKTVLIIIEGSSGGLLAARHQAGKENAAFF
jgi:hypothetical protein